LKADPTAGVFTATPAKSGRTPYVLCTTRTIAHAPTAPSAARHRRAVVRTRPQTRSSAASPHVVSELTTWDTRGGTPFRTPKLR
jgi:hypothetical protein